MSRNLLALSLFAVAASIVYSSTGSATAQSPRTPVCEVFVAGSRGGFERKASEWISSQLAAGKTEFISMEASLCAW